MLLREANYSHLTIVTGETSEQLSHMKDAVRGGREVLRPKSNLPFT